MYPNAINAVQTISQEKGVAGFYKGAVATISRDVAWNSLSFALFRVFLEAFAVQSAQLNYALGIVAGCLAACATHPIDVIKTRIMTSSGDAASVGIVEGLRNLVDEEARRAPLGPRAAAALPRPLASLVLATNEVIEADPILKGRAGRWFGKLQNQPPGDLLGADEASGRRCASHQPRRHQRGRKANTTRIEAGSSPSVADDRLMSAFLNCNGWRG